MYSSFDGATRAGVRARVRLGTYGAEVVTCAQAGISKHNEAHSLACVLRAFPISFLKVQKSGYRQKFRMWSINEPALIKRTIANLPQQ